ncbi:unnamed protein product [Polarella glacialis]|uniref:14 kDa phosphohistidine phosphatase n=1 Tax=Polarella glacialis TaxID=89957 RepID=A0A813FGP6_POLGL|nr:unnamed protein product [Polarella glacialis]CAE8709481.1 unnamed protein product [Polarella glacialis]
MMAGRRRLRRPILAVATLAAASPELGGLRSWNLCARPPLGAFGALFPDHPVLHSLAARGSSISADAGPTTSAEDQRQAAELRTSAKGSQLEASASAAALAQLPGVVVDEGTFKYVLLQVTAKSGEQRYLVRGTAGAEFHKDVAIPFVRAYVAQGFGVEILGGGRITHDAEGKALRIYGFSYGFPWADGVGHEISEQVCREQFPDYQVEWSNEGY